MKLFQQFIFLTVCGLMTVRGVVAMEEAQGGIAGETEVVTSEKQPVDGAAEASAPVGVLREDERGFLRQECLRVYLCKPFLPYTRKYYPDNAMELVRECDDASLFLLYIQSHFASVLPLKMVQSSSGKLTVAFLDINDFFETLVISFVNVAAAFGGKKLILKKEQQFEKFVEHIKTFASSVKIYSGCLGRGIQYSIDSVAKVKDSLLNLVTAVFAEGEELREITDTIKHSFTLEAIQKEKCETETEE